MHKTALLVVDLVNDFTKPTGIHYYQTTAVMMPRIVDMISRIRDKGVLIVYIQQVSAKDRYINPELKTRLSCVEGSGGELLDDRLPIDVARDIIVRKSRFSGFFRTELEDVLEKNGVKNVVVIGTKTNCCVRATATGACMRDYHTYLVSDCVSSNTEEISQAHLDDMAKYVARVIDSRELLDMVDGGLL